MFECLARCVRSSSGGASFASTCVPVFLMSLVSPGLAQSLQPSFNCMQIEARDEQAICSDDRLAELDLELDRLYRLAMDGPDMNDARRWALRKDEIEWLSDRRACRKVRDDIESCVANAYALRIHALREDYAGARDDSPSGISAGPVNYRCEGHPGVLRAVFFSGKMALVSLVWGARELVLEQFPLTDTARHEVEIWNNGAVMFSSEGLAANLTGPGVQDVRCQKIRD
ncbi:hypothetical protein LCM08_17790 [Salipiger pacificus]|nr:hypothetical protein [Alloyangia pacifica]